MRLAAVLIFTCVLTTSLPAQHIVVDAKAIDKIMTSTMKAWQIPGAAVAVVKNDRVIYAQGYGVKELGGAAVTPDTLFQIASTTKAFTSTALAMLVSDGKLSWDDPVRQHVGYFRLSDLCADSQVRLRDIVTHRTGLTRHDALWDNSPWTREDVIRRIGQVELTKPFRSAYQYQNITFIAAGEAVASASGMSWDEFMKARIFKPLGMTRTIISDREWNDSGDHASGYRYDWKTDRLSPQRPIDTATLGAAGAIKSNARDMGNWIRFHLANGVYDLTQLVDPAVLEETKTPHTVIRRENLARDANPETNVMAYGMGWVVQDYRGELLVSHAGALNGFRTHVDLLPERNAGFVVMINSGRGMAVISLRNALADLLSGKNGRDWNPYYLMIDRKYDEKDARDKETRLAKRIPNTTPTHALASYTGDYESRAYGTAKISEVDGQLVLQWSRMTIPLTHFHYDVFNAESTYDDVDEQVEFELDGERKVRTLSIFGETFVKR
ncbi:MAG TPA: serine hydrolase [Thermoanaerobaculia bacterium]|nr:serine hydrolase [Thermoanaerobaculia bacterium]